MAYSFLFGGDTNETPESIRRKRELAMAIMGASPAPKNVGEGLNALGSGIVAGVLNRRASKAEGEGRSAADALFQKIVGSAPNVSASSADGGPVSSAPAGSPSAAAPTNMSGNDVYSGFMDTVDDVITNPFGLAAVAATGQAESRFSPKNANRTWSDPSESGQAGTAGGIMSWRGPRLASLQAYAASKGEQGNGSPQTQAEFLVQEDPNLITALNNAKSVEEAQGIINRAWKFAGYDRPGGEAAERLATANAFLPNFQGQGQPQQVASLDPSVGMPPQTAAGAVNAMGAPSAQPSLTDEVAAFEQTPEYAQQFPGMNAAAPPLSPPIELATPAAPPNAPPVGQPLQVAQAQPQQSQPDMATLYQILTHPFSTPEQKAVAQMMIEQRTRQSDPAYQMGLEKSRLDLEAARSGEWSKLDDGRLYNQRTGEVRDAPADPNAPPADLGLNPQYGVDEQGNPVLLQLGKNGQVVRSKLPEGVTLSKEPIKIDAGTHFVLLDPITRQPVGQVPKNLADAESQKAQGKAQGEAIVSLPADVQQAEQTISQIDALINHPGLDSIAGPADQFRPSWLLGGAGRDALTRLDQLQGGAFLQAYGMLKGGGQITEVEGKKAEQAMARMNRALDEQDFRAALKDFRDAISAGVTKMRERAGGARAPQPVNIGGYTIEEVD